MSVPSRASLLLVFGLLFGLWTAAVHGPDHDAAFSHADSCAVCVFAQGLGSGVAASATSLVLAQLGDVGHSILPRPALYFAPTTRVRVRGPPLNPA